MLDGGLRPHYNLDRLAMPSMAARRRLSLSSSAVVLAADEVQT